MKKQTLTLLPVLLLAACLAPNRDANSATDTPAADVTLTASFPAPTATATPTFDELLVLGQDAANSGDWAGALAFLDQAIAANNSSAQVYLLRGDIQQASGDLVQALSDYDQALRIDPELASAYQSRGLAHAQLGNTDQALVDFSKAIEISPTFALAYRNRAEVQKNLGNTTAAGFDLQVYLTLVPNAPDKLTIEAEIAALQEETVTNAGEEGLLFFDDFSDPNSGWYTNGDPASPGLYGDGGYILIKNQPQGAVWALPGRIFSDVRIDVQATKRNGDDNNWFGVMCRVQGTTASANFYVAMISSDGYFGIAKKSGEELFLIGQEKMLLHQAIHHGNATNTITAVCTGNRIALYVNGEFIVETTDDEFASGQVGILAGTFDVAGTDIFFDDFSVRLEPGN